MRLAIALCILLVLAGCNGAGTAPATTPGETTTPATDSADTTTTPSADTTSADTTSTATTGSDAPVNGSKVWARVSAQCGVDRDQPITSFQENQTAGISSGEFPDRLSAFGISRIESWTRAAGTASHSSVSILYSPTASSRHVARVLAHEYGHAIQPPTPAQRLMDAGLSPRVTDEWLVMRAITEGIAVYVGSQYTTHHLDGPTLMDDLDSRWQDLTPATRLFWAPYRAGDDYAERTLDGCGNVSAAFEDPPNTTEQVLHPERRDEPPVPLSVNATGDLSMSRTNRMGELFTRIVLGGELPRKNATAAADGWGNDRFFELWQGTSDRSVVWVLRWDTPAEADEFESTAETYAERSNRTYTITRVDDRTVGLCTGNETLCGQLSYEATNATTVELSTDAGG